MPTVPDIPGPYRLFFHSFDGHEPPHVQVRRESIWSWRLANATPAQRQHFEIIGTGQGVHWLDIDEDLSAIGMLTGTPAPPPKHKV